MHFFSSLRSPFIVLALTVFVGASLVGILSKIEITDFSFAQTVPRSVQYNANGETMTLTRILANDLSADTGDKACAKLRGPNGLPMICKNNVDSFPYLGNKGCKQFYPWANERVSTYPGHGAHGGHYDILCLAQGTIGASATCSQISGDTCTTCPQCAKNLDCNEKLSAPSNFANGAIVRCFDAPTPLPPVAPTALPTGGVSKPPVSESVELDGITVVKVDAGETGHSACAAVGRVCVGPSLFNRDACLAMYPHAKTKNAAQGPQTEHFCKGGSTTGVCAGTVDDTCLVAVSSSQQVSCDTMPSNVDAHFVECSLPFSPEILEVTGGSLPPQGEPEVFVNPDGSVQVAYTVTVHSPSDLPTQIRVEWSADGENWHRATLVEDSVTVSDGSTDLKNDAQNQIGSVDRVDTDAYDSIVVDFVWDSENDRSQGGEAQLKITVIDDQGNSVSDTSQPVSLDAEDGEDAGAAEGSTDIVDGNDPGLGEQEYNGGADTSEQSGFPGRTSPGQEGGEHGSAGDRSVASQRCLQSNGVGETPCLDEQQLIQYLGAIVDEVIDPDTLTEKERAFAEFIKRFNALKSGSITDLQQRLEVFGHDLTRAEAVDIIVFLLLAKSAVVISDEMLDLPYSDVSYESPFAESIAVATAYDIVDGYPDGSFRPDQSPNRAEVARMVVRAATILHNRIQEVYSEEVLKLDEALLSEWFSEYLLTFARFGIILPTSYSELGQSVSGVAFLDYLYELLLAAGVSAPLTAN